MRILLTGSSGMVGRNLLEHPEIAAYEMLTPSSNELNLLNAQEVTSYLRKHVPDMIIHAAGKVGGIQANIKEPVRFLLDNLDMGRNIVGAAKEVGINKLLNLGSSCMYPRNAPNPLTEELILQGELEPTNEGYALAKIVTQRLCSYINSENETFRYKTLVPCNLYGRWDKFDPNHSHMIPAVIRKIHLAKEQGLNEVDIWGEGQSRREFMYAGDLADCIVRSIQHFDSLPFVMNVGLGFDYSINDYYRTIAKVVGYEGAFIHDLTKPVGMKQKLVSIEKQEAWGWKAATNLEQGLLETYRFYRSVEE